MTRRRSDLSSKAPRRWLQQPPAEKIDWALTESREHTKEGSGVRRSRENIRYYRDSGKIPQKAKDRNLYRVTVEPGFAVPRGSRKKGRPKALAGGKGGSRSGY